MTTVQAIIDNGFAKSAAARPESMTASAELVARVGQCLTEIFQLLSRENPFLLGASSTASFNGLGWPRPANALRVIKVVAGAGTVANPALAVGTEINVVTFDDPLFCAGLPSVYEFGQAFVPAGQSMDPSAGDVTIFYARTAVLPTQTGDSIDPLFPAAFNSVLEYDLAAYLAIKDDRADDKTAFLGLKNAWIQLLVDWAEAQTYSLQQRFPVVTPPLTNTDGGRQQPLQG